MKSESDLIYKIALYHIQGIGDITAKKLITYCGSEELVFKDIILSLPAKMYKRKM